MNKTHPHTFRHCQGLIHYEQSNSILNRTWMNITLNLTRTQNFVYFILFFWLGLSFGPNKDYHPDKVMRSEVWKTWTNKITEREREREALLTIPALWAWPVHCSVPPLVAPAAVSQPADHPQRPAALTQRQRQKFNITLSSEVKSSLLISH